MLSPVPSQEARVPTQARKGNCPLPQPSPGRKCGNRLAREAGRPVVPQLSPGPGAVYVTGKNVSNSLMWAWEMTKGGEFSVELIEKQVKA